MATVPVDAERFGMLRMDTVVAKLGNDGMQRRDRHTNTPLWAVRVLRRPQVGRSDFVTITVASATEPQLSQDAPVNAIGLVASDYHLDNGRSGLSFRADSIEEAI